MSSRLTLLSVIFSAWRLTLDVIQKALDEKGIQNIRFDGKVPQKERQNVINSFQTNANINIMLLTLSCGAVGYAFLPVLDYNMTH